MEEREGGGGMGMGGEVGRGERGGVGRVKRDGDGRRGVNG